MKIAYTFCGHARTWESCYKNFFDNVYSVMPGDIFIHTWDKMNISFGSYWNDNYKDLQKGQLELSQKTPNFKKIQDIYKPKILFIESERPIDPKKLMDADRYNNIYKQHEKSSKFKAHIGVKSILYASRKIFDLANSYDDYDILFCTRLDINYKSKIELEEIKSEELIVARKFNIGPWISDLWICGPKKYIDIKTNYYNHIDDYWYNNPNNNFLDLYHEQAMTNYLNDNKVPTRSSKVDFEVPRIFGSKSTAF